MSREREPVLTANRHSSRGDEAFSNKVPSFTGYVRERVLTSDRGAAGYSVHKSYLCPKRSEQMRRVQVFEDGGQLYTMNENGGAVKLQGCGLCPDEDYFVTLKWDDAACIDKPHEWFFPDHSHKTYYAKAKEVCNTCTRVDECKEYALKYNETIGVWGGTTPETRAEIRRERRKK